MQRPVEFQIDPNALATAAGETHRFVYAPTFAPYDPSLDDNGLVVLTAHQIDRAALFLTLVPDRVPLETLVARYAGLQQQICRSRADTIGHTHSAARAGTRAESLEGRSP